MINETLTKRYIIDLKKPEIDKIQRGHIIKNYMKMKGYSIRQFATTFDIHKSTVEDWLLYTRITPDEYKKKIDEGYSKLDIYKSLRNSKTEKEVQYKTKLDNFLTHASKEIRMFINTGVKKTQNTKSLLDELKNELNRLDMRVDK